MNQYMPGATNYPSPNRESRQGLPVRALILHIEGGSEQATEGWFTTPKSQVSAHFGVAKDGTIAQFVSVAEAAWSNGVTDGAAPADHGNAAAFIASCAGRDPNYFTVSIEHEGQFGDRLEGAQFDASVRIGAWLFGAVPPGLQRPEGAPLYGVGCNRMTVLRHSEIGSHPQCPGFPEDDITRYIAAVNAALNGGDVQLGKVVNKDAIDAEIAAVQAIGQQQGEYIGTANGPGTVTVDVPAGYRLIGAVVKEA